MDKINYESFIPELAELKKEISPDYPIMDAYRDRIGRYDHALAYSTLFWPEFTIKDDCVLLGTEVPASYEVFKTQLKGSRVELEALLNHRHTRHLFPCDNAHRQPNMLLCLGLRLKEMWSAKLRQDFPDRKFNVDVSTYDVEDPEITFWQIPADP